MRININNVKDSMIAGGNINIGTMEWVTNPGWKYEIRAGMTGLQTWTPRKSRTRSASTWRK